MEASHLILRVEHYVHGELNKPMVSVAVEVMEDGAKASSRDYFDMDVVPDSTDVATAAGSLLQSVVARLEAKGVKLKLHPARGRKLAATAQAS